MVLLVVVESLRLSPMSCYIHPWLSSHLGFVNRTKGICTFLAAPSQMAPPYRYLVRDTYAREVTQNMGLKPDCQNSKLSYTT